MASQLKFPLLCETCSIVGTNDYSCPCSLDFPCVRVPMGACTSLSHASCSVSSLHGGRSPAFLAAGDPGQAFGGRCGGPLRRQVVLPRVGELLLISREVSGEMQTLDPNTSSPKYLSADSETGKCCVIYHL